MPKTCAVAGCPNNVFSNKHCLRHQYIVKPPKRISPVSKNRARKLREYTDLKKKFLEEHRKCQANLPDCGVTVTDLHHKGGRGKNLNEVSTWLAVCRKCHDKIHNSMSMEEAIKRKLRIKRI